ncbi:MAG TPA: hypothetical protein DEA82_13480 [Flavobacteriaceae bacterium]|jgi:ribosomal protein S17E|nr:hypothetical protein [Flavobacteriaceae bacterium]MAY52797.1 hypothetical protein [Flavobacteriaceae bacterium]HBR55130.1 hypothetical protein [Flavobacteriaceae bacterium]
MKRLIYLGTVLILWVVSGCSSTKLVQQYKNPDTVNFEANKVLVVGISADAELRRTYEKKMTEVLDKHGVIAVKSIDFFETSFTDNKKSLAQLDNIEQRLLNAGFDAILFTKVTGSESRVTVVDAYRNFSRNYPTYEDYFYGNIHEYQKQEKERYQVYTTETSLYCICPGKERELLWRGEIEVVDADKVNRNINAYTKILFNSLRENKLLLL